MDRKMLSGKTKNIKITNIKETYGALVPWGKKRALHKI
jgi:hypothetical protein